MTNNKSELVSKIIEQSQKSEEFRTALIKDPKSALESFFNIKLPENTEIFVLEDTATKINLVLPYHTSELSDEDIENISGGVCMDYICQMLG